METNTQETNQGQDWITLDPATLNGSGAFSERVIIDPRADAYALVPPVPDGKYAFLLGPSSDANVPTLQGKHYDAKGDKPAMNIIKVNASLTIVSSLDGLDPKQLEGKVKRFDKSFSTFPRTVNGLPTNEVATILSYLGVDLSKATELTNEQLAYTLNQLLLSGTAQIGGSTLWKAGWTQDKSNPKDKGSWKVQGMNKFPLMPGGAPGVGPYNPIYRAADNSEYRAKAYLRNEFFSLRQAA